jgi:hypothetical protein
MNEAAEWFPHIEGGIKGELVHEVDHQVGLVVSDKSLVMTGQRPLV